MTDADPAQGANEEVRLGDSPSFWRFVPVADYQRPELPASGAVAYFWDGMKRRLGFSRSPSAGTTHDRDTLPPLPEERRKPLVPAIETGRAADALDTALHDWLTVRPADQPIRFVVEQPHAHPGLLPAWAVRHGAVLIDPPAPERILAGDLDWLDQWPREDGSSALWVLPRLAHCYLRHPEGLRLVRTLLACAEAGELGRGVIGCDSWAWAYLDHLWPLQQSAALTIQAFDGNRLARLLQAGITPPGQALGFCDARTGEEILRLPPDGTELHPDIRQLAAHSRGNPGIALAAWRRSLHSEPHEGAIQADDDNGKCDDGETVWFSAPRDEPVLDGAADDDVALLLHALLLH
ncbi:MAG TPA: hypothetical protein ENO19_05910, partial [Halothiobacillaceae bacterium]|nr:hypothetical protein [Halothiobacillaceae bacterium]